MSWKPELMHAAGSTTVLQVLSHRNWSCDWFSVEHILSFIHNKDRRANKDLLTNCPCWERPTLQAAGVVYQRGTIKKTVSKMWYLDLGGNLLLQLLSNFSYFFGLCPDTVLLSSLSLPMPLWSTCFTLYLLSALIIVLPPLSFNILFLMFKFLLLIFCLIRVSPVTVPFLLHTKWLGVGVFDNPGGSDKGCYHGHNAVKPGLTDNSWS